MGRLSAISREGILVISSTIFFMLADLSLISRCFSLVKGEVLCRDTKANF